MKGGGIGRFQVMAVLQAARAMKLGLDEKEAKSWGLNRAIFYAAAKRGFKHKPREGNQAEAEELRKAHDVFYVLGGEKAYRSRTKNGLRFKIGGKIQAPEHFDHQIKDRFDDWKSAWAEARKIIRQAAPMSLNSQSRFYNQVYKPVRDELVSRWSGEATTPARTPVRTVETRVIEAPAKRAATRTARKRVTTRKTPGIAPVISLADFRKIRSRRAA